ncbi:hypothetical protein N7471_001288 [Penicillium samsonianum]|uniref:uncharacterized protein n=1 Tax=Penicillium samsonianum TaxID=1882272 RepID=UPI002547351B|nr:uncharacterized protein N7471_001288 [Penicillium samsonianum]KAJ6150089.1 hypothetical protein N7471_001288 [Penicillium samsonianum]
MASWTFDMKSLEETFVVFLGLSWGFMGFVLLGSVFILTILRSIYNAIFHPLARYPGPIIWTSTFIPYKIALMKGTTHLWHAEFHRRYGPVVRVSPDQLSYISAQAWDDIYACRNPQLKKHPEITASPAGGVNGMANTPSDTDHARMRRELVSGFSERSVRAQENLLTRHISQLVVRLRERVLDTQKEGPGTREANMSLLLNATTYDIITDLTFGESANTLEQETDWIGFVMPMVKARITSRVVTKYVSFFVTTISSLFPVLFPSATVKFHQSNIAALDRRLDSSADDKRPDLLTLVMPHLGGPQGFSIGQLRSTVGSLMIAGSETTASVLTSANYFVLSHPQIYARLKEEVRASFEREEDINIIAVNNCKYMIAVLQETMRIWPAIPSSLPRISHGCFIDGNWVPNGTKVGVHQWSSYRSELNFTRPEEFLPERWLEGENQQFKDDKKAAFQPFNVGPRNCLGMSFAKVELRMIFARLLWKFDMELLTNHEEWEAQRTYIVWDRCPLRVKVRLAQEQGEKTSDC